MSAPSHHEHGDEPRATYRSASWPEDLSAVKKLFEEYRDWLAEHRDLAPGSQERVRSGLALVDRLISELPDPYIPPKGDILLWRDGEAVVACGALRELEPRVAEIRRIYVRPDYRGTKFGRPFALTLVARARELGYHRLKVDTLPSMQAAIQFYQEVGFRPTAPFWPHPVADALFFERTIQD